MSVDNSVDIPRSRNVSRSLAPGLEPKPTEDGVRPPTDKSGTSTTTHRADRLRPAVGAHDPSCIVCGLAERATRKLNNETKDNKMIPYTTEDYKKDLLTL